MKVEKTNKKKLKGVEQSIILSSEGIWNKKFNLKVAVLRHCVSWLLLNLIEEDLNKLYLHALHNTLAAP